MTDPGAAHLLDLMADRAVQIRRRMLSDSRFRTICDDYESAIQALKQWEQRDDPQSGERCAEYRALVDALAQEIREALDCPSPPFGGATEP